MGRMSELSHDVETFMMGEPDVTVGMAVRNLMSATDQLFELSASKSTEPLVRLDANDIRLAYTHLGRMLSRLERDNAA